MRKACNYFVINFFPLVISRNSVIWLRIIPSTSSHYTDSSLGWLNGLYQPLPLPLLLLLPIPLPLLFLFLLLPPPEWRSVPSSRSLYFLGRFSSFCTPLPPLPVFLSLYPLRWRNIFAIFSRFIFLSFFPISFLKYYSSSSISSTVFSISPSSRCLFSSLSSSVSFPTCYSLFLFFPPLFSLLWQRRVSPRLYRDFFFFCFCLSFVSVSNPLFFYILSFLYFSFVLICPFYFWNPKPALFFLFLLFHSNPIVNLFFLFSRLCFFSPISPFLILLTSLTFLICLTFIFNLYLQFIPPRLFSLNHYFHIMYSYLIFRISS